MSAKAALSNDFHLFLEIMNETEPMEIKNLGEKATAGKSQSWKDKRIDVMKYACFLKFSQNPDLLKRLLATGGARLVEATDKDPFWGSGINEGDRNADNEEMWPNAILGKPCNMLGRVLMELRDDFRYQDREPFDDVIPSFFQGLSQQQLNELQPFITRLSHQQFDALQPFMRMHEQPSHEPAAAAVPTRGVQDQYPRGAQLGQVEIGLIIAMFPYQNTGSNDDKKLNDQYQLYAEAVQRINDFEKQEGDINFAVPPSYQKEPLTQENLFDQIIIAIKTYRETGKFMEQPTNIFDQRPFSRMSVQSRPMQKECHQYEELLSFLNSQFASPSQFQSYLYIKQRESGLEGPKFFDFLMFLAQNENDQGIHSTYEMYFQSKDRERKTHERQREYEDSQIPLNVDQIAGFKIFHEVFESVTKADFKRITDADPNLLANYEVLSLVLEEKQKKLDAKIDYGDESNHSFKEQIRKKRIKTIGPDGDCLFLSLADGLNQIEGGNYNGFKIRQQIADFEEQHCDMKLFPPVVVSKLSGEGVFVPEESDLALKMMDEKESGLQIDLKSIGGIEKMILDEGRVDPSSIASIKPVVVNDPSNSRRFYSFGDCSSYAKIMRLPGVYGTENELRVAALIYGVAIVVRIGTGVKEEFHYFFPQNFEDSRRIIYMFKAQKHGHYDSMEGAGMMDGFDICGLPVHSYIAAECIAHDTPPPVLASRASSPLSFSSLRHAAAEFADLLAARPVSNDDELEHRLGRLYMQQPVVASRPTSPPSRPNVGPNGELVGQPVVAASAAARRNAALAKIRIQPQGGKSKRKHNIMNKKKHTTRRKRGVKGGKSRRCRKPCNKNLSSKF